MQFIARSVSLFASGLAGHSAAKHSAQLQCARLNSEVHCNVAGHCAMVRFVQPAVLMWNDSVAGGVVGRLGPELEHESIQCLRDHLREIYQRMHRLRQRSRQLIMAQFAAPDISSSSTSTSMVPHDQHATWDTDNFSSVFRSRRY